MPKILHESEGLTIKLNDKNSFCVVTLFYYADPSKRSPQWEKEARAGITAAKFAKEYLIDYTALFGEKMFPELASKRNSIVVPEPYPEWPEGQVFWGGLDYGARNPTSFHVYTLDNDGIVYSVWELFEPCKNIKENAAKMKDCPYWKNIKYIAADPSLWGKTQRNNTGALCSNADFFMQEGIYNMIQGNQDESAWVSIMRTHWTPDDPTFKIYSCCVNQIREFDSAIYASMSDKLLMNSNYREQMADHNNHSLDDCKYFMNSRPRLARKLNKTVKMIDRWLH